MKVLILSCNTGEGHNSAGRAIREALRARGVECEMIDFLQFSFKGLSKVVSRGHVFAYRHLPHVFGAGYMLLEGHNPEHGSSVIYRLNSGEHTGLAERLRAYILARGFDTVICVHVFPISAVTYLREKYGQEWRQYFVCTDYTCSPGTGDGAMEAFFIPHADLLPEFTAAGIEEKRVVTTGIPVSARFLQHIPMAEAREKLGLTPDRRSMLVMGGSMGAGNIVELVRSLCDKMPEDGEVIVICGHNKRLQRQLENLCLGNAVIVGYTDQVDLYMEASELLLTKAGGLSSTEALMKRLPLVYLNAVPGCETRNRDFICKAGCAITENGVRRVADAAVNLFGDEARLMRMRRAIDENFRQRAADDIAAYLSWNAK